jgi:DNA-binding XRE family transcriptional regulator
LAASPPHDARHCAGSFKNRHNHRKIHLKQGDGVGSELSEDRVEITPAQCRAARALVDFTQRQLADAAGLSVSTLADFERSIRPVSGHLTAAIRRALETAGVEFTNGDEPGLRLRKGLDHLDKWTP